MDPSVNPDRSPRHDKKIDFVQFSNRKQFMQKYFESAYLSHMHKKVSSNAHAGIPSVGLEFLIFAS